MRTYCIASVGLLAVLSGACSAGAERTRGGDGGFGFDFSSDAGVRPDAGNEPDLGRTALDAALPDAGPDRLCITEVCSNGLDDDCNGLVDDTCACVPGDSMACFRGAPVHRALGACRDGTMLCAGLEFGLWGLCAGDVLEGDEVCDAEGVDEDCDGAPNDGCECSEGDPPLPCGSDVGECSAGMQRCESGMLTACVGAVGASAELCDGLDNDCNGAVDEGLTRTCGVSVGRCRSGIATCSVGVWGSCVGEVAPGIESCDGTDEDCDGSTDESTDRPCGIDTGECVAGIERCTSGVYAACAGAVAATIETCNGRDDDCDGAVDESLTRSCGTDVGICVAGAQTCSAGAWPTSCAGETTARTEVCDGANDDDCDGTVDEGCGCVTGMTRSCGTAVGACATGSQICNASGAWAACVGAIDPVTERCNGSDDDCDGLTDEGCDCITGASRTCGSNTGECVAGTETCDAAGRWASCAGSVGPVSEICNTRDDDCDGASDEGGVCPRFPPLAMCPAPRTTTTGSAVSLTGMGSDPDGGAVSFAWTVVVRPGGSSALPSPTAASSTSFTPDAAGDYTLRLCVTDDELVVTCCTTTITAMPSCAVPSTPAPTACGTSWDRRPIVEVPMLPAGIVYQLFLDASATPYGTVSTVGQNYFRPAAAIGVGGPPPGTSASIGVRACRSADLTCCSPTANVSVTMIEACTTARAPAPGELVFSEYVIDGDGPCSGPACEAGEAFEITNLTNCPLALAGEHFSYCNGSCATGSIRSMDFGAEIVPPRGVLVAIRERTMSACGYPFFGADDPALFGLRVSTLAMVGSGLASGWFTNSGGGQLRIATGPFVNMTSGTTLDALTYSGANAMCGSNGYDALDRCGDFTAVSTFGALGMNQLGRLWHPCDAVTAPLPSACR